MVLIVKTKNGTIKLDAEHVTLQKIQDLAKLEKIEVVEYKTHK